MAKRTREEIEALKDDWLADGCWDIEDSIGFEEHREELLAFRKKIEKKREEAMEAEEKRLDEEAEALGLKGMYRMLKKHAELLDRHHRAIAELGSGNSEVAHRILRGYDM